MDANACGFPIGMGQDCRLPRGHSGPHVWEKIRNWEAEVQDLHIELSRSEKRVQILRGVVRGLKTALVVALEKK